MTSAYFALFLVLVTHHSAESYTRVTVDNIRSLLTNETVLAIEDSGTDGKLWLYTTNGRMVYAPQVGGVGNFSSSDSSEVVNSIARDPKIGRVTVDYFGRCITATSPNGTQSSIGQCQGKSGHVRKMDIYPFAVTIGPNSMVVFTDEFNNAIRQWNVFTGEITTIISEDKLNRPKGIVYDSTLDSYYVTISNGIYSTKDKRVITGVPDVNAYGFNDGSFTEARFGHVINLALLQPGMLAVADYTSNRVRLVDVLGEMVSTLCVNTSCTVKEPISVTLVGSKTLLVGTHTGFSSIDLSWSPVNLCYGVYNSGETVIKVDGVSMKVWCDLDTPEGPWITLLNRYDGSVDFNRTYQSYTDGFGDLSGEHWLGLEYVHQLTKKGDAKLRIDIEGFPGRVPRNSPMNAYAEYERFMVGDSKTGYELKEISGYSGTAGDMETTDIVANLGGPHKGKMFSAKDKDEDEELLSCAEAYNGGWWFSHCYTVCLTCGPYYDRAKGGTGAAMIYYPYTLRKTSLKSASMKVKLPESFLWTN